jgi:NCAIR mutase (PurE)-related protein
VVSVNVLSGFVSALYAALIAAVVRRAEQALP